MNELNINVIALALGFAFSAGSMAAGLSKDDYNAGKDNIAAEYKVAKERCDGFAGGAKEECLAQAKAHFGK